MRDDRGKKAMASVESKRGGEELPSPSKVTRSRYDGAAAGAPLIGLAAVQAVFHFLLNLAGVLRAATACRRWRELTCADSVWRGRFEREGLRRRRRARSRVALPAAKGG